jgi:hypothetical protein
VGTVIAAVAVGLGGGYLAANIANPPLAVSKLERRMSSEPISVAAAPAQPAPRAIASATSPAQVSLTQTQAPSSSDTAPPETAAAAKINASPLTNTIRAEEKPAGDAAVVQPVPPALPSVKPTDPNPAERSVEKSPAPRDASVSRDASAKARDADIKRAEAEKRRAERRQAWVERRKVPQREELDAVEERVREVTEPRRIRVVEEIEPRAIVVEQRSRGDVPRIRLFGLD